MSRNPSLKFRIIGIVLVMFVGSFWLLTFVIGKRLEQDMFTLLEAQQFSAASYIASDIEAKIVQRIDLLNQNAKLVAEYLDSPSRTREFLKGRIGLQGLFQAGLVVIDKNGQGFADYPVAAERQSASFRELEYFQEAISTGKTVIGKPRIGRFTKKPGVAIAAPIRNASNEIVGVLVGFATLSDKSLFGQVEHGIAGKSGWILVTSPRHSLIVSSSDPANILQPAQSFRTTFNPDNLAAVSDSSKLSTTSLGIEALVSTKEIPSAGWLVQMVLPTQEALVPIHNMTTRAYGIAIALTGLTLLGLWFFIRRALKPLDDAASTIRAMTANNGELHMLDLDVDIDAEIKDLLQSFNTLVNQRKQSEETIRESEARLNRAELASKSGNWELHLDTQTITTSQGARKIYGADNGQYNLMDVQRNTLPEYRPLLDAALKNLIENDAIYDVEFKIKTADTGEIKGIHSIAIFDKEKRIVLGVIQDVTERLRIQQALADEISRRRLVFERSRDGICLLRTDGGVAEFNSAFAEMLGYPPGDIGQLYVWDWDIQKSRDELEKITCTVGPQHRMIETRHQRKDGTQYDVEVSVNGVEWSGESYLLCLHRDITARKQAEERLLESENRLRTIIDNEPECIKIVSAEGRLIQMNPAGLAMIEADSLDQVAGCDVLDLIAPEHRNAFAKMHQRVIAGESMREEFEIVGLKGRRRWLETHAVPLQDHGETVQLAVTRDITESKEVTEKLQLAASVFSHCREGIVITSADATIIDVNDAFSRITGYDYDEVIGKNPRLLSSGRHGKPFYTSLWHDLISDGYWYGEVWNRRKNGEVYAEMLTISAVRDSQGNTQQYVALFSDITPLKEHERQLEHMAHYDVLTSLPNRILLADRLQQAISQAHRRGQSLAVCYLDLDGFKAVNDSYGHETGDQLLIALSARMKQVLRESDTLARIGGDEFVAVLLDLADDSTSSPMFNRLLSAVAQPVSVGELKLQVSASLGITFYPQAEDMSADQLLRQADQAMYQAKQAGKNRYQVFKIEKQRIETDDSHEI
ncbi:MAG: PAS domain S-box protein [Formivibrio sp.]|nr:PAS domain S-box protein [Formivibrio sp.]